MTYFETEEQARKILSADYTDRINHSPMRDGEEIRAFFEEINKEDKDRGTKME